jgi:hypothetical protein
MHATVTVPYLQPSGPTGKSNLMPGQIPVPDIKIEVVPVPVSVFIRILVKNQPSIDYFNIETQ